MKRVLSIAFVFIVFFCSNISYDKEGPPCEERSGAVKLTSTCLSITGLTENISVNNVAADFFCVILSMKSSFFIVFRFDITETHNYLNNSKLKIIFLFSMNNSGEKLYNFNMSKKTIKMALFIIIFSITICCNDNKKDSSYFNGEIQYYDDSNTITKNVICKSVSLNGIYAGMIAVYDSLLICWHPEFPNHFFSVFNVDTGEEIGFFCEKGQGPREAVSVNCIYQFFRKGNDVMTLLDSDENKLFFWNISQSIKKGTTVYDTIVPFSNNVFFNFYKSDDTLLAFKAADFLNMEDVSTPFYEKRTIYSNELIQVFPIYKKTSVKNIDAEQFFYTWDAIKPDGSKIVQAMWYLPQINILDTYSGNLVGYRMKNGSDFSLIEANIKSMDIYYNCVQADDHYIYATYWGKEPWNSRMGNKAPLLNTIHVFDWEGNLLYELITDKPFFRSIWLDVIRNRLYTMNIDTDEVYYLDMDEFINSNQP